MLELSVCINMNRRNGCEQTEPSYWTKRRRLQKKVSEHLEAIESEENAGAGNNLVTDSDSDGDTDSNVFEGDVAEPVHNSVRYENHALAHANG